MRLISQLIKGISKILQIILKYFNDTTTLTSFVFPAAGVFPVILILNSNDSEFVKISFGSSL